jgi:signal transduction histidine kinase
MSSGSKNLILNGDAHKSAERYRAFIQQSSEGIWRFEFEREIPAGFSPDEQIEFALQYGFLAECNEAMAKMYGFEKPDDLIGSRIRELFDLDDAANFNYFRSFIASGYRVTDAESHEKDRYGNDNYFLNNMVGVVENGVLTCIWGTKRHIPAQKRSEKSLITTERRASEDYLKLLSRIVPLAQIFGASRDLPAIYRQIKKFICDSMPCTAFFISFYEPIASQRIAAYAWGLEGEVDISTLPPMPLTDDGGPNSRAVFTGKTQIVDRYMEMMKTRPHIILQENGIDPQASLVVPMAVMGRVIGTLEVQAYESGSFQQEHIIALEMVANLAATAIENVRLLESEAQARKTAEIANHAKDEFIAVVSHELRSPLNAMLGWARILQSNKVEKVNLDQALETIIRNARTQSKLIEDLLDTARITSGKLRLEMKPVNLSRIIKSVIEISRPAAEAKEISIFEDLDPGIESIKGDPDRLQQIINNLFSNAIKFSQKGGEISVRLNRVDSLALITVKDTGIGIKPEFLPRIFDQFTQSDPASTQRYGGLGIGLALARKLVELHGGTIRAESEGEGKGATFIVALPLRSG